MTTPPASLGEPVAAAGVGAAAHGGGPPRSAAVVADPAAARGWHRALGGLAVLLGLAALLPVLLATFAAAHWSFDLLAHFPLHCALALLPAAVVAALTRRWAWAALFGAGLLLASARLQPQLLAARPAAAAGPAQALRVASVNLRAGNDRVGEVAAWLAAVDAQVVAISELTPAAWVALADVRARFPHHEAVPRPDCFGIALLSQLPLEAVRTAPLGHDWAPAITATVRTAAGPLGVAAVHPPPPGLARRSAERNRSLRALPALLAPLPPRRIVIGDLNATPWSAPFQELLDRADLVDSTRGAGLQGSWPVRVPAPLRIPIDHVLVSPGIGVLARELGPEFGSDHLPLAATLSVPVDG